MDEASQFHIPKIVQYIISIILRAKEGPTRYKMSFIAIMESHKAFTNRTMK